MTGRFAGQVAGRFAVALLAGGLAWVAACSWRDFVEQPAEYTGPALTVVLIVAAVGAVLRGVRLPWPVVLLGQVLVLLVWLHHHLDVSSYAGGWIPTPDGLRAIADQVGEGASAINTYAAPVRAARFQAPVYLLAVTTVVVLAVDAIALGLRRPTWAGLPVLVALTVPISILDEALPIPLFVGVGVLFAMLLAAVESDQVLAWGQAVTGRRADRGGDRPADAILDRASAQVPAMKIGLLAAAGALVLPLLVPVSQGLLDQGKGTGAGPGDGQPVRLKNPMADLRRDLRRTDPLDLLTASTDAPDPSYLRTTVLDTFTGSAWVPGPRDLPRTNVARGSVPDRFDTSPTAGTTHEWRLSTTGDFITSWLPTPFRTRTIQIDVGDWRYDLDTLDIASTDEDPPRPVRYDLTSFAPVLDPARLASAGAASNEILRTMTRVPRLTDRVTGIAEEITAGGTTDYAKAVLLQNWFRSEGGFTYSLDQAPGDGMAQLERFITTDKSGYCEQFAAAMAVMTRSLGIPSRVVVGFLEPARSQAGTDVFTTDDLHAWPEVYFRGTGWVRFEPTPASRTGAAPSWTRADSAVPTPTAPTSAPAPVTRAPNTPDEPVTATSADGGSTLSVTALVRAVVLLLLLAALAVPALLRRVQRRRRLTGSGDPRADVENLWTELRATAADVGIPWPAGRSPRTVARAVANRIAAGYDDVVDLQRLVSVLEEARYRERFALTDAAREASLRTVARWSALLTEAVPDGRRRRARVLPRSVLAELRRAGRSDTTATKGDGGAGSTTDTYVEVR